MQYDRRIPAFGGELLGSEHGEFLGELAFRSSDGRITPLLATNVRSLHATPAGFIAVTGLAHLRINGGAVLSISRSGTNRLTVDKCVELPGAPLATRQYANGTVAIKVSTGRLDAANLKLLHACLHLDGRNLKRIECPSDWRDPLPWSAYECARPSCGAGTS